MKYSKLLLSGVLALGLTGCDQEAPVKSDYKGRSIIINTPKNGQVNVIGDTSGQLEQIFTRGQVSLSGYDVKHSSYPSANERVRALSEKILEIQNELSYEIDKQYYELSVEKTKNTSSTTQEKNLVKSNFHYLR